MSAVERSSEGLKLNKSIYKWPIPDFCFCCKKVGEKLSSPVFTIGNTRWLLDLYPRGVDDEFSQYMSLFLRKYSRRQVPAKFKLSILDSKSKNYAIFEDEFEYHPESRYQCGKSDFVKQTEMTRNKSILLPNNTLTICCEISTDYTNKEDHNKEKESETTRKRKRSNCEFNKSKLYYNVDGNMYEIYFDNKQYSDVQFVTEDKNHIHAHKVVLISKSKVFASLFSMNIPVLSPDIVIVNDIDYEVLYEMLRFIYTDTVDNIDKYAVKLFNSADRFKIIDLKVMCERYLNNNLSIMNAIDVLILAENFDLKDLKEEVKHFIALNVKDFIDLPDFQELAKYHSKIVVEIIKLSVE